MLYNLYLRYRLYRHHEVVIPQDDYMNVVKSHCNNLISSEGILSPKSIKSTPGAAVAPGFLGIEVPN